MKIYLYYKVSGLCVGYGSGLLKNLNTHYRFLFSTACNKRRRREGRGEIRVVWLRQPRAMKTRDYSGNTHV